MPLFCRRKEMEVQSFLLKIVNNNCAEIQAMLEGPRAERRVNLTMVVLIVPIEKGRLALGRAFTTVTKEFSTAGLGLVLSEPMPLDEIVVGFRWEGDMTFVRAKARHMNPLGGGFQHLGLQLTEMASIRQFPELESMVF